MFNFDPTAIGTKGDQHHKYVLNKILEIGCLDKDPRPHYADGTPAHTLSYNGEFCQYDISKGEFPIVTLRPIATKSAIGELLWIYQDQTTNLDVLKHKYGVDWWSPWALDEGGNTIGQCYGATVRKHNIMDKLLDGIKSDPDGRRHIIDLWQYDDFNYPHGLKPCAFLSIYNVRHRKDGIDYLDAILVIR